MISNFFIAAHAAESTIDTHARSIGRQIRPNIPVKLLYL